MKMFCQKCGEELNNSKICSNCGFENKITRKSKRVRLFFIILTIFIIVAGILIFRGKLENYYKQAKNYGLTSIIDPDIARMADFRKAFAEYEFAEISFEADDGLENYMKHLPEIEDSLYEKYREQGRASFMCNKMKIESECPPKKLLSDEEYNTIQKAQDELYEALNNCEKDKETLEKCSDALNYAAQKCKDCDSKISKLYEIASSFENQSSASSLLGLVDLLRAQQSFYDNDDFIKLHDSVATAEYCIEAQSVKWVAVKKMSEAEINKAVSGKDIKDKDIALHFIKLSLEREGKQFNKGNVLEEISNSEFECNQRRVEYEKQLDEKWNQINENLAKINDYIAMLNGSLNLNIKTWQSDRSDN